MKSGGVQLFIFQKWGGQILKWGDMTPTFNGGDAPDHTHIHLNTHEQTSKHIQTHTHTNTPKHTD